MDFDLDELGVFQQIFTLVKRVLPKHFSESAPLCVAKSLEAETGASPHLRRRL